jgi:hypothetical protein
MSKSPTGARRFAPSSPTWCHRQPAGSCCRSVFRMSRVITGSPSSSWRTRHGSVRDSEVHEVGARRCPALIAGRHRAQEQIVYLELGETGAQRQRRSKPTQSAQNLGADFQSVRQRLEPASENASFHHSGPPNFVRRRTVTTEAALFLGRAGTPKVPLLGLIIAAGTFQYRVWRECIARTHCEGRLLRRSCLHLQSSRNSISAAEPTARPCR